MQLDLFNEVHELEVLTRLKKVEDASNKTRRSLFARINELEREVIELRNVVDVLMLRKDGEDELKIKNQ